MTQKPTKKTFDKLTEIDKLISKLYEERDKLVDNLVSKYGTGQWVVDSDNPEKPFLRLSVVDNLIALSEGKQVWKSTGVKRYSITLKELKNKPKVK